MCKLRIKRIGPSLILTSLAESAYDDYYLTKNIYIGKRVISPPKPGFLPPLHAQKIKFSNIIYKKNQIAHEFPILKRSHFFSNCTLLSAAFYFFFLIINVFFLFFPWKTWIILCNLRG